MTFSAMALFMTVDRANRFVLFLMAFDVE
jgi:hypothetical protein